MTPLRGILFDFNGTLCFDSHFHAEAFREYYRLRGRTDLPDDDFMTKYIFGKTNELIYREQFDLNASAEEIREYGETKENLYFEKCLAAKDEFRLV